MIVTTTYSIEGKKISKYLGVIAGEAIMGVNILKDAFAGIRDVVGGRSGAYEEEIAKAREIAMQEITAQARKLGAEAIVGVDVDYQVIGKSMLMVSVTGTAVVVE